MTSPTAAIGSWAIIVRSLRVIWSHKFLWFFGFFASLNAGAVLNWTAKGRPWFGDYLRSRLDVLVIVVMLAVIAWLTLFLMSVVSRGALIAGTAREDARRDATFPETWSAGLAALPRMLALTVIALVAFIAVSLVCVVPIALSLAGGVPGIVIALVIGAVLLLPYLAFVFGLTFTITYAERAVAAEGAQLGEALRRGLELTRSFFWKSVVFWLAMLLPALVFAAGIAVVGLMIAVPFVLIGLANLTAALLLGIPVGLAVFCPAFGAYGAFQYAAWTLFYRELARASGGPGGGLGAATPKLTQAPPARSWAPPARDMSGMGALLTEARNPRSLDIDRMSALELVDLVNSEDATIAAAVGAERERIAAAIDLVVDRFRRGGRLFYVGAGTSGRLGVLDAAECPPTFGTDPSMVQGLIAGGYGALVVAKEGAEDNAEAGAGDMRGRAVGGLDVVVGIATSGVTPYVVAALGEARAAGAATVLLSCTPAPAASVAADIVITPLVGPEVVTGSTRMKAGTATKLVLNTVSTSAMVLLGKTYENLMVDLTATCDKLRDRACRILVETAGVSYDEAVDLIARAGGSVKTAIVMAKAGLEKGAAEALLAQGDGFVRRALALAGKE